MKKTEVVGLLAAVLFVASLIAAARRACPYQDCARYRTYAQDAMLQMIAVMIGHAIGMLTKRPLLWGAVISICGIVAFFTLAHCFEASDVCRRLRFVP